MTKRSARDPIHKGWFTGLDLRIFAGREVPLALATFSLGAGAIHFAVTSAHFTEYWVFGVFFAALGWYQAIWAVLYTLRPGRMLGFTALLVNAGTVALWFWTRTVGVPIGPKPGELEPIGAPDIAATIFEVAIVFGLLWFMSVRRPTMPRVSMSLRMWLLGGLIVLVTATTALVLFLPTDQRVPASWSSGMGTRRSATVTSTVLRPEGRTWKVVHRHADSISATRPADSVIERYTVAS